MLLNRDEETLAKTLFLLESGRTAEVGAQETVESLKGQKIPTPRDHSREFDSGPHQIEHGHDEMN